jgi:hypothetical protein
VEKWKVRKLEKWKVRKLEKWKVRNTVERTGKVERIRKH